MKQIIASLLSTSVAALLFAGCTKSTTDTPTAAGAEGAGGSMAGAGGAGPGFDGSGSGSGKGGTVPDSISAQQGKVGNSQTNSAMSQPGQPTAPTPESK